MNKKKGTPLREQIIRRVQQAILDSGMTYKQIAEKSGLSALVIASYMMRDPRLPSVETLAQLLPVLGVSADEILKGEE